MFKTKYYSDINKSLDALAALAQYHKTTYYNSPQWHESLKLLEQGAQRLLRAIDVDRRQARP